MLYQRLTSFKSSLIHHLHLKSPHFVKNSSVVCDTAAAAAAAAAAKSLQSCPTLCDPIDGSPPGSPHPWDSPDKNTGVGCHLLLQCRKVKVKSLSRVRLFATPWTAAYQAPLSMGFSRQEYWSGVPSPSPVRDTDSILICHVNLSLCKRFLSCM